MEIEILRCADPDQGAVIAAQAMLDFLIQGKYAPSVGQENLAMLSQPQPARIAHNQARTDLIFKTFDVKANRRLGEIHLTRRVGKAAGVADGYEGS